MADRGALWSPSELYQSCHSRVAAELSNKSQKGIPTTKTSADIANAPGGAKDPNQRDEVPHPATLHACPYGCRLRS